MGLAGVVATDSGSCIAIWPDERNKTTSNSNLFAMRVKPNGDIGGGFLTSQSIASGNWNDPAVWVGGMVPAINSNVVINTVVTVAANTTCNKITVVAPGQLIVATGVTLKVNQE